MKKLTRRALLHRGSLAAGGLILSGGQTACAEQLDVRPAYMQHHEIKPLPFNPSELKGLSRTLMATHHQTHYTRAVQHLNSVQRRLAGVAAGDPDYLVAFLKREELTALNSKILHELFFGALGGNGNYTKALKSYLSGAFGSPYAWRSDFVRTAMSVRGGNGWAALVWNPYSGQLQNIWSADDRFNLAGSTPLLVADMSEHAYSLDYGDRFGDYLNAFLNNVSWDRVEDRLLSVL